MAEKSTLQKYLKETQASADAMNRQLAPLAELHASIVSSIPAATSKALESVEASLAAQRFAATNLLERFAQVEISPLMKGLVEDAARFEKNLAPFVEMSRHLEEAARSWAAMVDWDAVSKWSSQMSELWVRFEESNKTLPHRTRRAVATLNKHGWCFDLEMPFDSLWKLEEAIDEGKIAEAEDALCRYYGEQAPKIIETLRERYPHRAKLLASALGAHQRGEYELAIPVFFTQADGICQEAVHVQLCKIKKKKEKVLARTEKAIGDAVWAALMHPLTEGSPLTMNESDRGSRSDALNRHLVLHGESTDYGTLKNSLQAIALLNYVAAMFEKPKVAAA